MTGCEKAFFHTPFCVVGPWCSGEGHERNKSDFIFVNRPGGSFAKKEINRYRESKKVFGRLLTKDYSTLQDTEQAWGKYQLIKDVLKEIKES